MDFEINKTKESYKLLKEYIYDNVLNKDTRILILCFPKTNTEVKILVNENKLNYQKFIVRDLSVWNFIINELYINYPKTIHKLMPSAIEHSNIEELNIDVEVLQKYHNLQNIEYWNDKILYLKEDETFQNTFCKEIYHFMNKNIDKVVPQSFFSNEKSKWYADFDYSYKDNYDFLDKILNNFKHALYCFNYIMKRCMDKNYQQCFSIENSTFRIKNYEFKLDTIYDKTNKPITYVKYFRKLYDI